MNCKFKENDLVLQLKNIDNIEPEIFVVTKINQLGRSKCVYYHSVRSITGQYYLSITDKTEDAWVNIRKRPDLFDKYVEYII